MSSSYSCNSSSYYYSEVSFREREKQDEIVVDVNDAQGKMVVGFAFKLSKDPAAYEFQKPEAAVTLQNRINKGLNAKTSQDQTHLELVASVLESLKII